MHELIEHADHINELLARYGVKFGIYKNNQFKEQLFPFDAIPRVIAHEEFERLENNRNYAELLRQTMDHVNTGGHNVILTPGRYNAGLSKFTVNIRIIRLNVGADFLVLVREKNSLQLGVGNVLVKGPVDIVFSRFP